MRLDSWVARELARSDEGLPWEQYLAAAGLLRALKQAGAIVNDRRRRSLTILRDQGLTLREIGAMIGETATAVQRLVGRVEVDAAAPASGPSPAAPVSSPDVPDA